MKAELILAIIETILKYGPSAVSNIAVALQNENVTPKDIKNLRIDKEPEDYFGE